MSCFIVPIQGGWTSWAATSNCSGICVGSIQTRARSCTKPVPAHGGEDCIGNSTDTVECGTTPCGNMFSSFLNYTYILSQ